MPWIALLAAMAAAQAAPTLRVEHFVQRAVVRNAAFAPRSTTVLRICGGGVAQAFPGERPSQEQLANWLLDVDAITVDADDLPFWMEVAHDQIRLLSTNARDRDGQRLGKPFLVRELGSVRLALLAVIARPLAVGSADEPVAALQAVLPDARKESDAQLVVVDGDVATAAAILRAVPQLAGAIATSDRRVQPRIRRGDAAFVVQSPTGGTGLGQLDLSFADARLHADAHRFVAPHLDSWGQQRQERWLAGTTAPVAAEDDAGLTPRGLAGIGIDPQTVNDAITRGAEFLWQELGRETGYGQPLGSRAEHVLAALALVHTGLHERSAGFDLAVQKVLRTREVPSLGTYGAGLFAMLIEAYAAPQYYGRLRETARWLVEAQSASGSWTYHPEVPATLCNDPDQRILQVTGGQPLDGKPEPQAEWQRQLPWTAQLPGDNSLSQFALLGLRAAQRGGVPVPAETWRRAAGWYRRGQRQNGGFGYGADGSDAYGSMTLAGICSLAICAHMLGEPDFGTDIGVRRGLAWMRKNFAIDKNPENGSYLHYYLYSLERTGRILDREFVAGHEWYALGVRQLLALRKPDGSWEATGGGETPLIATSFALLFLTRATRQLHVELARGGNGTLVTAAQAPPDSRFYVVLDASGSMLAQLGERSKFDVARSAVQELLAALPARQPVALRAYGHRRRAVDKDADLDTELLLPMQPLDHAEFAKRLAALRARGKTPLARSLQEAAVDLAGVAGQGPLVVILLTDGGEDTMPRQDPVAATAALAKLPNLELHVVGFDIQREDWVQQLRGIAAAAHGTWWSAGADDLARDLRNAVLRTPDHFIVTDAQGREVARGHFGDRVTLPEGRYHFATEFGGKPFAADLWINTEAETAVVFAGSQAMQVVQGRTGAGLCPGCGRELGSEARFCSHCGAPAAR